MANFENKIVKQKKLGKELNLTVKQNDMSRRIYVEFSSDDGKLFLQKSFQDTEDGAKDAEDFQKSLKTIADLRKYFGLTKPLSTKIREVITLHLGEKNVFSKRSRRN